MKRTEETAGSRRSSDWRLSHVQSLAQVGDWEWDLESNVVSWSEELYRIYGFAPHEIVPDFDFVLQRLHPECKAEFQRAVDAALKGEKPLEIDYIFYRGDGREAVLHAIGEVIRNGSGAPVRMVGIVQDITEQRRAETLLRLSEDKFRTIFDTANDGILIIDSMSSALVDANRAICGMLGYSRDELAGMGVADIHPKEGTALALDALARLSCGTIALAENIPVKRKDGTVFFADISASAIHMQGKPCLVGIFRDITRRRCVEEDLRVQGKRFAESQRIAHIGSWEHNLATNQVYWSDELFRLLGLDPGKDKEDFDLFVSMVHPDDQPLLQKSIEDTLKFGKPFNIDYRFVLPDGTLRFIRAMAELIPDRAGKLVVLSGTAQDVSERKMAEDRLYEKNTMLQTLLNTIPDAVIFKDSQGRYVLANKAMEKITGIKGEEIIGMTDDELSPPDVAEKCKRSDAEAIRRGCPASSDERYIDRNGETRFLDVVKAPIHDPHGNLQGIVVVSRDITERKRVEDKIQKNEEYVRNILNTVDEGFIVVDRDYRIHSANRAYCDQVGLRENQVTGRYCFEVSHKRSTPCHEAGEECCVKEVFARGEPYITYHRHEDADGNTIYVETKAFPLLDASGFVSRAIETVSDITEKRLLEDERLKVQKLEAIGTLAGGIAHDFNNLLQGVFGYISMAKLNSGDNRKAVAALEEAERALQLTVRMTNQLLTFSKGGKPVVKPTDLRAVIDNAVRFSLSGSSVHCRIAHPEDLRQVEVDEGQITQVVQNIILNAVQAMPAGGKVVISTRNFGTSDTDLSGKPNSKHYAEVTIRDTGTGIRQEDLARIFDPYFTTKETGSGLGLATSYSIVKNHGGWIKVDSLPGEGTTFRIYLPVAATCCVQAATRAVVCEPGRTGKILVMDDEPMICQIAGGLINMLGHEVDYGKNGEEAFAKYLEALQAGKPFDAVILDLTVKGGSGGAETVRKLRAVDPGVKAVVSSGYADSDIVANYRDHGFMAVLNKPYDVAGLQKVLNEILGSGAPGIN